MEANEWLVIAMMVSLVGLMLTGFPVAWVLGGVGVLFAGFGWLADMYLDTATGLDFLTLGLVVNRIYQIMDNWVLVALPMFIYMGIMLDKSGVAERLMLSMQLLFGRLRGGLALSVTLIGILLAAATGIIGASVVLLGLLSLPVMLAQGYDRSLAAGTVAAVGTLGILLPPSIMLVIMADQLGLSVGDLFIGAVFPGLLLGALYVLYILFVGWLRPQAMPAGNGYAELGLGRVLLQVGIDVLPPLTLVVAVLGSIFAGIATPTEASGIGAFGATLLAGFNRRLNLMVLGEVLRDSFKTTATIFAIFLGATCFALVLRELGGDELIESMLTGLPFGPWGVVALVLGMVFLLGFVLDWLEITLIFLPLLAPIVAGLDLDLGTLGEGTVTDPTLLWFVVLVAVALQTSFLTPPVGFALFYLKGVCPPEIRIGHIYRGVVPFVLLQLLALGLVIAFPALVLWLPSVAYS
jgi:tripartite ATP-independent transporter DctM subunit